ncbi:M1 family metallopeptidase [Spirillospora sp. NPDC047279]|uniref:M1 family metallopeptidase n=1 Tax=Spirillospora sp. NPDC047279 TaxID=3155478 RepID=UPI0033E7AFAF
MTSAGSSRSPFLSRPAVRGLSGLTALALAGSLSACTVRIGDRDSSGQGESVPPVPSEPGSPGQADSAGDPYVPGDGNTGYDVQHYKLKLGITPGGAKELDGTAEITATATKPLSRFNLDLTGLDVAGVTVDGAAAQHQRQGSELIVSPAKALANGAKFTVTVRYSGTPKPSIDPGLDRYGWIRTPDGVFVGCQPSGAHTWFPANDHPSDKATFDFEVTVPAGLTAVANGEPTTDVTGSGNDGGGGGGGGNDDEGTPTTGVPSVVPAAASSGRRVTTTWRVKDPMATYLATVTVGKFDVKSGKTPGGIPIITAVDPSLSIVRLDQFHAKTAQVTDELVKLFGPYPFTSTGGIVDNATVNFALETQTRPVYSSLAADETIIAHELAHMWYGDSVSVTKWKDIWLNEGFATYAEWMWAERIGRQSVQETFDGLYEQSDMRELWNVPPGNPGRDDMFGRSVYDRGGMTLHALRKKIGDEKFFQLLKTWAKERRHSNATTAQFVETAERVAGQQLDTFFEDWLYKRGRPAL